VLPHSLPNQEVVIKVRQDLFVAKDAERDASASLAVKAPESPVEVCARLGMLSDGTCVAHQGHSSRMGRK